MKSRKKIIKVINANFITKAKSAIAKTFAPNFAYALA
jgi:hypothetical protein